ncbi:hypothetical protein [Paenibacillus whitsoniae]|uniref:DUF2577 domain-containing protein n=1 Tax=Paenibacillus whitsoniae TaxID=2496558 RepID=A0A3S0A0Y3_9BACL|nr:hypothetical protein [Paenibacillus whitsoniae]RTE05485.1 hypothetical protein EJQ19_25005 [Paenibacillus whitsoniae]
MMNDAAWLVKFIRDQTKQLVPQVFSMGTVVSPDPFQVKLHEVVVGAPFLLVDQRILQDAQSEAPTIQPGDTVVILHINDKLVVISKAVSA